MWTAESRSAMRTSKVKKSVGWGDPEVLMAIMLLVFVLVAAFKYLA
jgi:hypothetical protein